MSAAEAWLSAGMEALTRGDAGELARIAERAQLAEEADLPATAAERSRVEGQLRALGRLLVLTRRNLRLLRGGYAEPCGYRAPEAGAAGI